MTNLSEHCVQIDDAIVVLRRHIQGLDVYNSMMKLGALADLIERHRQLCENEYKGLEGDARAVEAAYEEKAQELGECRLELIAMRHERDDWKQDAAECDSRTETANQLVGTLKNENDSLKARLDYALGYQALLSDAYDNQKTLTRESCVRERDMVEELYRLRALVKETGKPVSQCGEAPGFTDDAMQRGHELLARLTAMDQGAPDSDVTVTAFTCTCGVKRSFTQPKLYTWTHVSNCSCGAQTVLRSDA